MPGTEWKRRDVLKTLAAAAAAGVPALTGEAVPLRRVGIVGGGMAGVSLAWLLDGACHIDLIEAGQTVGGNIRGVEVELDGHAFVVDMGAQYFHPGPYPLYTALLTHLGLHSTSAATSASHAFPASITVMAEGETTPRFVSPILPDRTWPLLAPWNAAGIAAFGTAFPAAKWREVFRASWTLTLDEWLPTLGLTQAQWEGMLLPWAASLFSGSIEQARGLSARAVMIFAAKALPPLPWDPVLYYALTPGMGEALRRMLDQCRTVEVRTGARVEHVVRNAKIWCLRARDRRRCGCCRICPARPGSRRRCAGSSSTTHGSRCTRMPPTFHRIPSSGRSSTATSASRSARRPCGWRPC